MDKATKIKYAVLALLAISVLVLGISMITAFKNKGNGDYYKELIQAKDETIKAVQVQRDIYKEVIEDKNRELGQHFKNDSILATQSKRLTIKYESIPNNINSLDREGLRAEFHNY